MKKSKIVSLAAVIASSVLLVNCTKTVTQPGTTNTAVQDIYNGKMFDNVGGFPGIDSLNNAFIANILSDNELYTTFNGTIGTSSNSNQKQNFVSSMYNFLVTECGGPNIYQGPGYQINMDTSMGLVHKGMGISGSAFDDFCTDLQKAINTKNLDTTDGGILMREVKALRPYVVGR